MCSPPAANLGFLNQVTSCLSLQDTELHSKRFLGLPWILIIMWPQKLVTLLFAC